MAAGDAQGKGNVAFGGVGYKDKNRKGILKYDDLRLPR